MILVLEKVLEIINNKFFLDIAVPLRFGEKGMCKVSECYNMLGSRGT